MNIFSRVLGLFLLCIHNIHHLKQRKAAKLKWKGYKTILRHCYDLELEVSGSKGQLRLKIF